MAQEDYDILVAAHLLRNPHFCVDFGPLILQTEGRFFSSFFLRDIATYAIEYFLDRGVLLPPQAIKVDVSMFGRTGASDSNYERVIDQVWEVPDRVLDSSRGHVSDKLVGDLQQRLLGLIDWESYAQEGRLDALYRAVDEIRTLSAARQGEPQLLSEGLQELLSEPPVGIPTGVPDLDSALSAGGLASGETLLWYGRWSIGKSILLHHTVRTAAQAGHACVLWSHETSEANTRLRLVKGLLGVPDGWLRANPELANRRFLEEFGNLPLFVRYSPPRSIIRSDVLTYLDRCEQKLGRKIDLIAFDYSEKRAEGRDWNQVCDAYQEVREICGERGMAGVDVAQENNRGEISYTNLLKDADVGIQLTVLPPDEWRRKQRSIKAEDAETVKIPTEGPVWGEIVRAREGKSGDVFQLWVNRERGHVEPRRIGEEL